MFQESSVTEEVEKQLQGAEQHTGYKKQHSGSTTNIHGLIATDQMIVEREPSVVTKLSTFTGGSSKSSLVQMRRPTNRKGKTAPAPPKRTSLLSSCSSFRDSTFAGEDREMIGDTLDDPSDMNGMIFSFLKYRWLYK